MTYAKESFLTKRRTFFSSSFCCPYVFPILGRYFRSLFFYFFFCPSWFVVCIQHLSLLPLYGIIGTFPYANFKLPGLCIQFQIKCISLTYWGGQEQTGKNSQSTFHKSNIGFSDFPLIALCKN